MVGAAGDGRQALLGPTPGVRRVLPRALLEALSPTYAKAVLGATYCSLVLGIAVAVLTSQHLLSRSQGLGSTLCPAGGLSPLSPLSRDAVGCVQAGPGNTSAWTGAANSFSLLDGDFSLQFQLQGAEQAMAQALVTLAFRFRFEGGSLEDATAGSAKDAFIRWDALASGVNATASFVCPCLPGSAVNGSSLAAPQGSLAQAVYQAQWESAALAALQAPEPTACSDGMTPVCDSIPILSAQKLAAASSGGYSAYNATLAFPTQDITALGGTPTFSLVYRAAVERVADVAVRSVLLLVTAGFALVWWWRVAAWELRHMPSARGRGAAWRCCCSFRAWMPFRRWVGYLLIAMLLWQNPLFVVLELLPRHEVAPGWLLAADMLSAVAWACLFLLWLLFMDGLRYVKLSGSFPIAFYLWKALFALAFVAVAAGQVLLLAPQQWACLPGGRGACSGPSPIILDAPTLATLRGWLLGSGILYGVLLGVWSVWFTLVMLRTGRVLRRLPYGPSRLQQLTFRFFMWQQVVVVLFVLGLNLVPLVRFLIQLVQSSSTTAPHATPSQQLAAIITLVSSGQSPPAEYLVVTIYALVVATVYLPPPPKAGATLATEQDSSSPSVHTTTGTGAAGAVLENGVQWLMSSLGSVVGSSSTVEEEARFSIATAGWLFDLAWAVYFDPPEAADTLPPSASATPSETGALTESGAGSIGPLPHGFALHRFVYSADSDTAAMIMVRGARVVVAFRGTASAKNVRTDLSFMRSEVVFGAGSTGDALVREGEEEPAPPCCTLDGCRACCARNCACFACVPGVRQALPLVHQGFWAAYSAVRLQLRGEVLSALADAGPNARLYFTGHSLGGALAQMAAFDMREFIRTHRQATARMGRGRGLGRAVTRPAPPAVPPGMYEDPLSGELRPLPGGTAKAGRHQTRLPHLTGDGITQSNPYKEGACGCLDTCSLGEGGVCGELLNVGDIADEDLVQHLGDFIDIDGPLPDPCVGVLPNAAATSTREGGDAGITVYTFGSPRVGNPTFAGMYDSSGSDTFRVEADGDAITNVPKFLCLYKHVGTPVLVDVFGNAIVAPSFIEQRLQAASKTSFTAHSMNTYRRALINARGMVGLPLAPRLTHNRDLWAQPGTAPQ